MLNTLNIMNKENDPSEMNKRYEKYEKENKQMKYKMENLEIAHNKSKDEIRELKIQNNDLIKQGLMNSTEKENLNLEISRINKELKIKTDNLGIITNLLENYKNKESESEKNKRILNGEILSLKEKLNIKDNEMEMMMKEQNRLKGACESMQNVVDKQKKQNKEINQQIISKEREYKEKVNNLNSEMKKELEKTRKEQIIMGEQFSKYKLDKENMIKEGEKIQKQLSETIKNKESDCDRMVEENEKLKNELNRIKIYLKSVENKDQIINDYQNNLNKTNNRFLMIEEDYKDQIASLKKECTLLKNKNDSLSIMLESSREEEKKKELQLQSTSLQLSKTTDEKFELQMNYNQCMNIIHETKNELEIIRTNERKNIEKLQEEEQKNKEMKKKVMEHLLENESIKSENENYVKISQQLEEMREINRKNHEVHFEERKKREEIIQKLELEKETVTSLMEEEMEKTESLEQKISAMNLQIQTLHKKLDVANQKINEEISRSPRRRNTIFERNLHNSYVEKEEILQDKIDSLENQVECLNDTLRKKETKLVFLENLESDFTDLKFTNKNLQVKVSRKKEKLKQLRSVYDEIFEKFEKINKELQEKSKLLSRFEKKEEFYLIEELNNEIKSLSEKAELLEQQLLSSLNNFRDLDKKKEFLELTNKELIQSTNNIQIENDSLRQSLENEKLDTSKYEELHKKYNNLFVANEELSKKYQTMQEVYNEEKEELNEKNSQLEEDALKLFETLEALEIQFDNSIRQKFLLASCFKEKIEQLNETINCLKSGEFSSIFEEYEQKSKSANEKLFQLHIENEKFKQLLDKFSEKDPQQSDHLNLLTQNENLKKKIFELKVKLKRTLKEKQQFDNSCFL